MYSVGAKQSFAMSGVHLRPRLRQLRKIPKNGLTFSIFGGMIIRQSTKRMIAFALLAQLDRVFGYEPKGQGFESLAARHAKSLVILDIKGFRGFFLF